MNTDKNDSDTTRQQPPQARSNGGSQVGHEARSQARIFASRATNYLSRLPATLDEQLKENPYRVLGIACAVGVGAGIALSSRVLRTAFASAASIAIVELGRGYLRREMGNGTHNGSDPNSAIKFSGVAR